MVTQAKAWDLWLECRSQREIAEQIGTDQATVSRWTDAFTANADFASPPASRQHSRRAPPGWPVASVLPAATPTSSYPVSLTGAPGRGPYCAVAQASRPALNQSSGISSNRSDSTPCCRHARRRISASSSADVAVRGYRTCAYRPFTNRSFSTTGFAFIGLRSISTLFCRRCRRSNTGYRPQSHDKPQ